MNKKLKRSRKDKVLAGVCGGIGEYFNMDPVIIRILWVLLAVMPGFPGFLAYIACVLVIPLDDGVIYQDTEGNSTHSVKNTPIFIGIALIVIGGYMLARVVLPHHLIRYLNIYKYWPVLLIIGGIYIIAHNKE